MLIIITGARRLLSCLVRAIFNIIFIPLTGDNTVVRNWEAPTCNRSLHAVVKIPGSKSQTNRALLLAAIASHQGQSGSRLIGALQSRDTNLMIQALKILGFQIVNAENDLLVYGQLSPSPNSHIDCGLAGTVLRFIPPLTALTSTTIFFDGDQQAQLRPITPLLDAMRKLGMAVTGDHLPFSVSGSEKVTGGIVSIDASTSSQFISGLLLSGVLFEQGLTVIHHGSSLPSTPHIAMTVRMLRQAGAKIDDSEENHWHVYPGSLRKRSWVVEPDLSNAVPFLAAAVVTGGHVSIDGWPEDSVQPDSIIREILSLTGSDIYYANNQLVVRGQNVYSGFDIDLHDVGELTPSVAALAALAQPGSVSSLRGIAHLRGHETDRLEALSREINRLGGQCVQNSDGLVITATKLHGGCWHTYADHRMATAGAIIGLRVPGVQVENIATTAKTLPDFPALWSSMLTQEESL